MTCRFLRAELWEAVHPGICRRLLLAFLVWTLSRQFLDLIDEIGLDQTTALGEENVMPDNPVPSTPTDGEPDLYPGRCTCDPDGHDADEFCILLSPLLD